MACACHSYRMLSNAPSPRHLSAGAHLATVVTSCLLTMELPVPKRFGSAAELYPFLPPDAQALVRAFTAHPLVAIVWTSDKFVHQWALSQGYYDDWRLRHERLRREGLPLRISGAQIVEGFFAVHVEAEEEFLLRPHTERGFDLHLTLGYESDYTEGQAACAVERINRRWQGRSYTAWIEWIGSGGAAFLHAKDLLALDPDVAWFHSRGWYSDRGLHISL